MFSNSLYSCIGLLSIWLGFFWRHEFILKRYSSDASIVADWSQSVSKTVSIKSSWIIKRVPHQNNKLDNLQACRRPIPNAVFTGWVWRTQSNTSIQFPWHSDQYSNQRCPTISKKQKLFDVPVMLTCQCCNSYITKCWD